MRNMTSFVHRVFFARLALRLFVDDYELGDVNVSLITVQLRCAFMNFSVFSLTLFSVRCASRKESRIPDKLESFLFFVWVKQPVTRCPDFFLKCQCVR